MRKKTRGPDQICSGGLLLPRRSTALGRQESAWPCHCVAGVCPCPPWASTASGRWADASESQHLHPAPPPHPCILSEATPWEPQSRCAFLPSALPIQSVRMAARPVLTAPVKLLDNGPQEWWGSQFLTQCWSTQTHHTVGRTHAFGSSEVFPELWLAFCL